MSTRPSDPDVLEAALWNCHWRIDNLAWVADTLIQHEESALHNNGRLIGALRAMTEIVSEAVDKAQDVPDDWVVMHRTCRRRLTDSLINIDRLQQELNSAPRTQEDCRRPFG